MEKLDNRIELLKSRKNLARNIVNTYESPNKNYAELINQLPYEKRELANKLFPAIYNSISSQGDQRMEDAASILAKKLGLEKELSISPNDAYANVFYHTSAGIMTKKQIDEANLKIQNEQFKNAEYFAKNKEKIDNLINTVETFREYINSMPKNYISQLDREFQKRYNDLQKLINDIIKNLRTGEYKLNNEKLRDELRNMTYWSLYMIYYLWDYEDSKSFFRDFLNTKSLLKKSVVYKNSQLYEHIKTRSGRLPADIENLKNSIQKLK